MEDKQCQHPINRIKKKYTGYWCMSCAARVKHISFVACEHQYKIGTCRKCKESQRLIGDYA